MDGGNPGHVNVGMMLALVGGGAAGRRLPHQQRRQRQPREQQRQQEEGVRERQHHALLVRHAVERLECHPLRIRAEGGKPQMLIRMRTLSEISIHPDGRRIAFTSGPRATGDTWAIENFLPESK